MTTENIQMRTCYKCFISKPLETSFYKSKDKYQYICKVCDNARKKVITNGVSYNKNYYMNNKNEIIETSKKYYKEIICADPEKKILNNKRICQYGKAYYEKNKEQILKKKKLNAESSKRYYEKNKEQILRKLKEKRDMLKQSKSIEK
jgi:hypothetical protein